MTTKGKRRKSQIVINKRFETGFKITRVFSMTESGQNRNQSIVRPELLQVGQQFRN